MIQCNMFLKVAKILGKFYVSGNNNKTQIVEFKILLNNDD